MGTSGATMLAMGLARVPLALVVVASGCRAILGFERGYLEAPPDTGAEVQPSPDATDAVEASVDRPDADCPVGECARPAPMPFAAWVAGATGTDGRIYAVGTDAKTSYAAVYDPGTNRWTSLPPMPTRRVPALVTLPGNRIAAIGGFIGGVVLSTVEIFDVGLNRWSTGPSLPEPRYGHGVASTSDGRVFVVGGVSEAQVAVDTVFVLTGSSWTTASPMPSTRWGQALVAAPDGSLYVLAGQQGNEIYLDTIWRRSPSSGQWETLLSTVKPRRRMVWRGVYEAGRVWVPGGADPALNSLGFTEVLDPLTGTLETLPTDLNTPRSDQGVATAGGRVYVFGGCGQPCKDPIASVEVYVPSRGEWLASH